MRTLIFSALLLLAACSKDDNNQPVDQECYFDCQNLPMDIRFAGTYYLPDEVDTIIVRQYVGDGTFSSLISETVKTYTNSGQYDQYGAFIQKDVYGDGNDYEIEIPGAGQTYRIWNIASVHRTDTLSGSGCTPAGHYQCSVPVKEFEISGGAYTLLSADAYTIMLKH